MLSIALLLVISYLIGAIPFGYLVVLLVKGIDIRQVGSGNIGATNVGRVIGWKWFPAVFLLDFLKGALPVWLVRWSIIPIDLSSTGWPLDDIAAVVGLAALVGHMWPIYIGFKGGKGVATGAGVLSLLLPVPTAVAVAAFVLVLLLFRYVSLGAIIAAIVLVIARFMEVRELAFNSENRTLTIFCIVGAGLVLLRHRSNMFRLWQGNEKRIGERTASSGMAHEPASSPPPTP